MLKEFAAIKDILVTIAATASLISLVHQAPIDPLLKGFLLGFLTASITSFFALSLFLRNKKKESAD